MDMTVIDYHSNLFSLNFELTIKLGQPFLKKCSIHPCFLLRSISASKFTNVLEASWTGRIYERCLNCRFKLKENMIYLSFQSLNDVWCCKIVVIEGLSKFMSFLQKNRTIDWNVLPHIDLSHFSKVSFNSLYVPVFILPFGLVKNFEKLQRSFLCFSLK